MNVMHTNTRKGVNLIAKIKLSANRFSFPRSEKYPNDDVSEIMINTRRANYTTGT